MMSPLADLPLFDHQRDLLVQLFEDPRSYLLAGEPGTGKTLVAIGLALDATTRRPPGAGPVVYALPANLLVQTAREFRKFAPSLRVGVLRTGKDALPDADVIMVSYTLPVASLRIAKLLAGLVPLPLLIYDESHMLRNVKAARTKFWIRLTQQATRTLLASGTPMVNSPEDLFSTLFVLGLLDAPGVGRPLADGSLRKANFNEFCANFVVYGRMNFGGKTFVKPIGAKNTEQLQEILALRTTRWIAQQLLSLPSVIHGQFFLDIPDPLEALQRGDVAPPPALRDVQALLARQRAGEQINRTMLTAMTQAAVNAMGSVALTTYRRAIGALKAPGVAAMVADRLEAGGAPTLIFGHHREALERIRDGLVAAGVETALIYGDTSPNLRTRAVEQFTAGKLNVLVLQIDVAGLGLNLQRAGYVVFAELPWTSAAFEQAVARAQRIGQQQRVQVDIATVPDSLDEAMIEIIRRKRDDAQNVFDRGAAE